MLHGRNQPGTPNTGFLKNLFGYEEGHLSILDDGTGSLALEIFLHMFTNKYICSAGGTLSIIIQAVFMGG